MYIAIYSFAIVLFAGVVLFLFQRKQRNRNARIAKMQTELVQPNILDNGDISEVKEQDKQTEKEVAEAEIIATLEEENKLNVELEASFEDFYLDGENKKTSTPSFATIRRKTADSFFKVDDEVDDVFSMIDEDDNIDEEEIARYEKSLRESLNFDVDEEFDRFRRKQEKGEPFNNDFVQKIDLEDFDINQLHGKSQGEIVEMIKTFPPKAQEIILTDILARKNWDD